MITAKFKCKVDVWYEFLKLCKEKDLSACDMFNQLIEVYTKAS